MTNKELLTKKIENSDLMYIAGMFETKGHLYVSKDKKYSRLTIYLREKKLVDFLKDTLNCLVKKVNIKHKDGYKTTYYTITITGKKIEELLKLLKPYFKGNRLIK